MSANVTRRTAIAMGAAAFAAGIVGIPVRPAMAAEIDDLIAGFTGGAEPQSGRVSIDAPETASAEYCTRFVPDAGWSEHSTA